MGIAVSQPDGSPANSTVFLADRANARVNTYHLDGSSPAMIGSSAVFAFGSPQSVAVDSRGVLYVSNTKNDGEVERYDTENANGGGVGFLAPISVGTNEVQQVTVSATAGTFNLTYDGETTVDLPFSAPANDQGAHTPGVIDSVEEALTALPSIGGRNLKDGREVRVSGGPGDAGGTSPYRIEFDTGLGAQDVEQIAVADGATPLSGGSGATAMTLTNGKAGLVPGLSTSALAVDPDSDGPGPEKDVLYVQRTIGSPHVIQQFGPANEPGLIIPPAAFDAVHGSQFGSYNSPAALAIDQASGRIYVGADDGGEGTGSGVYVLDTPGPGPSASLESLSDVTPTLVTAHATITPNGPPALKYHLEFSTDGVTWESGPEVTLGTQKSPQALSIALEPGGGFKPQTLYHVRLVAKRPFFPAIVTPELTFTSPASPPLVETTGSPVRTTTTARLDSRVDPAGAAATYHFEYGEQGPCESNPCTSTESHPAGSGEAFGLVSQQIEELEPNTTYHYRVIADNGNPGSPVFGEDMTLTTFADEAPLSHGHFPGPPGSDRAWEMASEADSGGNPVAFATAISDNGNRVVYGVHGGTPLSEIGQFETELFGERTPSGWQTKNIYAHREDARGSIWKAPGGPSDLSSMVSENTFFGNPGEPSVWRLTPDGAPEKLYGYPAAARDHGTSFYAVSDDGSRTLFALNGTFDPAHPLPPEVPGLYDISSGTPKLVSLLPDGSTPPAASRAVRLPPRISRSVSLRPRSPAPSTGSAPTAHSPSSRARAQPATAPSASTCATSPPKPPS
jgi:hypothetical protein